MRATTFVAVCLILSQRIAFAADPMAPSDIQTTFFTGQAFTAATPSGTQYKMTFSPDGKMIREPLGISGYKAVGTWKLNSTGYCTSWKRAKAICFTVIPSGESKWSVKKDATTIAVWTK